MVKKISDYVNRAIDPKTGLVTNLPGGGSDYLYGIVDWPPQMRYGYDMTTVARTTENIQAVDVFVRVADLARGLAAIHRHIGETSVEIVVTAGVIIAALQILHHRRRQAFAHFGGRQIRRDLAIGYVVLDR